MYTNKQTINKTYVCKTGFSKKVAIDWKENRKGSSIIVSRFTCSVALLF